MIAEVLDTNNGMNRADLARHKARVFHNLYRFSVALLPVSIGSTIYRATRMHDFADVLSSGPSRDAAIVFGANVLNVVLNVATASTARGYERYYDGLAEHFDQIGDECAIARLDHMQPAEISDAETL